MLSKSDIQIIREEIVVPMNKRFDRLETKVDKNHQEFLEFKKYMENFVEYTKDRFEAIQYRLEDTYYENKKRVTKVENALNNASKDFAITTPK